jgi:sec-independent protein translocase protein TatB
MFDIGWQELFVIGVVALIVVGPKDLPKVLRGAARVLNKARGMSREFQAGLAEMAREVELDEIKRNVERTARFDLDEELQKAVDPTGKLSADFDPAEFNRKLKQNVEASPPARYPLAPPSQGASDAVVEEQSIGYPLGDPSPPHVLSLGAESAPAARPSAPPVGGAVAE